MRLKLSTQDTLWRRVCNLPLEMGKVFAYLPLNPTMYDLIHFAWPINDPQKSLENEIDLEYRRQELEFIATYMALPGYRIGVFRGQRLPPGKALSEVIPPLAVMTYRVSHLKEHENSSLFSTEIYYLLSNKISTLDHIKTVFDSADRMPLMGILSSLPDDQPEITAGQALSVDLELLEKLAWRAEYILVSAYDDDATLIWSRV